jgi:aminotransferase
LGICNPGDEIIVPTPCFVAYEPEIIFAGGVPVTVTCKLENNFEIKAEEIEPLITPKTKAIFLAFPNTYYSNLEPKGKIENMSSVTTEVKLIKYPFQ